MTVLVVHPSGSANSRALGRGLAQAGMLDAFFTMLALPQWLVERSILPRCLRAKLSARVFDGIPWPRTHTAPLREIVRIASGRVGLRWPIEPDVGWASIDALNLTLSEAVAAHLHTSPTARTVYAYEDVALEAFRAARADGIRRVYELPIAGCWRSMRRILAEERDRAPEWAPTIGALGDLPAKLGRKDEELELAEHIVVASAFARQNFTAEHGSSKPVHIIGYGAPAPALRAAAARQTGEPLRVAYVGHLSQAKGLSYLFEAVGEVASMVQLTLIGPKPARRCAALERALEPHTWAPPVPHAEVLRRLAEHHVLVFPSLCEGFGLVILEAMAQGVPVITTTNTGGPDVIEDGVDGLIVPIRDPRAIAERLSWLYDDDRRRRAMAHAARRKAADHSWARYQRRAVGLLSALAK